MVSIHCRTLLRAPAQKLHGSSSTFAHRVHIVQILQSAKGCAADQHAWHMDRGQVGQDAEMPVWFLLPETRTPSRNFFFDRKDVVLLGGGVQKLTGCFACQCLISSLGGEFGIPPKCQHGKRDGFSSVCKAGSGRQLAPRRCRGRKPDGVLCHHGPWKAANLPQSLQPRVCCESSMLGPGLL